MRNNTALFGKSLTLWSSEHFFDPGSKIEYKIIFKHTSRVYTFNTCTLH